MTRIIIYIYEFKKAVCIVVVLFTVIKRTSYYERNYGLIANGYHHTSVQLSLQYYIL